MKKTPLRSLLLAMSVLLMASCGGGGGGGGGGSGSGFAASGVSGSASATNTNIYASTATQDAGTGPGASGSAANGSSNANAGSTATASNGNGDSSGVGSGGTGVSTADASSVGSVGGLGSVILNGLRYNTDTAASDVQDAPTLEIGMSVKITGPVNADFTAGTATRVESAAELNGRVANIQLAAGTFTVMGTAVTTDSATVWANAGGLAAIAPNTTVQVWGLPSAPGALLATRVEQRLPAAAIVTGTVQNLDARSRTFTIGALTVDYRNALFASGIDGSTLSNGAILRVRAATPWSGGTLSATFIQRWYPLPQVDGTPLRTSGIVTGFTGLGSFQLLGTRVDASAAKVTGGPAKAIGNDVKIEVDGTFQNGVLHATAVRITHIPGDADTTTFTFIGPISAFKSVADFKVKEQRVDASGGNVLFVNGSIGNLQNGTKVTVSGARVEDGILEATRVEFN